MLPSKRGIDPNVEDPTQCHVCRHSLPRPLLINIHFQPHSEVPQKDEDWPSLTSILQFQARVRTRLLKLYEDIDTGRKTMTRKIGRVLFMTFEHEALHSETLLYMLIQRAGSGTIPPPGFAVPPWASLAANWNSAPEPKDPTVILGPATVTLGHDDFEGDDNDPEKSTDVAGHEFGWDNEHPKTTVHVDQFRISWRPVTNGQFYDFYKRDGKGKVQLPASWVERDSEILVRLFTSSFNHLFTSC